MVKISARASAAGRREHWDTYNPVNDKLAGIVGPLALGATEAAFDDSERTRTMCNTYRLPYGKMSKLPPALFGAITKESVSLDRPLTIPTDDQTIAEMADSYFAWATSLAQTGDYSYVSVPDTITLVDTMSQLKGQEYPVDEWTAAAQATQ